jgi:hypothetical protein
VDGLDGRVKAPKQTVVDQSNTTIGHYAYWVGDESIKANFSVQSEDPEDFATSSAEYRNYLQVPQRVGWERMTGFDILTRDPYDPIFSKVITHNQIALVGPGLGDVVKENFHHITSYSESLLTDAALGGLKKDLTRYLEDGGVLNDDDPIADPALYDVNDSRFAAWGGNNTGFPNDSDAALDGIPTWSQIRDWYNNESASGGGINPDADTGVAPVISYIMFNGGWSYDGTSKTIRLHWMPCIVLWNPYDVPLNSASYNLDLKFGPALWQNFICEPNPTLAKLQTQAGANWQPDADPLTDANGDGNLANDWTFTDIDGVTQVIIAGDPDAYDIDNGPFVEDADLTDGVTDAFGRFYYRAESPDPEMYLNQERMGGTSPPWGPLGGIRGISFRFNPHHSTFNSEVDPPFKRPMQLRIQSGFAAGEAKVRTPDLERIVRSRKPVNKGFYYSGLGRGVMR